MKNKTANVKVRLTVEEHEIANKKADALGISTSEFIRRLINSSEIVVRPTYVAEVNWEKLLQDA